MKNCKIALNWNASLGESPRWHPKEKMLYWVDIDRSMLHRFDPATGHNQTMRLDHPAGCFAFTGDGGFLLAMKDGFSILDRWEGTLRPHGDQIFSGRPHLRFNDGRTDPAGRFWAGSVDMEKRDHDAALYCLEADGSIRLIQNAMLTCNGAAFDAAGRRFFHADTPSHAIRSYDADPATGTLSNERILHQLPLGRGRPDGGSVDAEGHYWSALFDGGRVVRLSPDGKIVDTVALPVTRPTMIAFGGEDLRTAYVTTARKGLSDDQVAKEPLAGSIFSFRVKTPGLPETPYLVNPAGVPD